ncbi:MAG: hypothetical protein KIH69_016755 [Anaerolineae bacterium]|nr:hypothetical protein [Anaerolineae bacterium]
MDFLTRDLNWLLNEARNDPATATQIIEALAGRVEALQTQSDTARAESLVLRRSGQHQVYLEQIQRLKADLRELRGYAGVRSANTPSIMMLTSGGTGLQLPRLLLPTSLFSLANLTRDSLRDARPIHWAASSRLGQLLVILSSGRAAVLNALNVPLSEQSDWAEARQLGQLALRKGERVEAMCAMPDQAEAKMLVIVTRQGLAKAIPWSLFEAMLASGQPIISPKDGDGPVWVGACGRADSGGVGDLFIVTRNGRWLRFPIASIEPGGSVGIPLQIGDEVAGATEIAPNAPFLFVLSIEGALIAVANEAVQGNKRPGGKTGGLPKGFLPLGCAAGTRNQSFMTLSLDGNISQSPLTRALAAPSLAEARPLNLLHQRLCAWAVF